MSIQFFNFWYFLFVALSLGGFAGLYFLLRNRSQRTVKAVLIGLIVPCFVILVPVCFLISLIFDFQHFRKDLQELKHRLCAWKTT